MITTNFNPSVITTQRNLNMSTNNLTTALERMSTGYKVNCAADDAAGMFVTSRLNANIRGLTQAKKNAQDGISLLNTADGSLSNMTNSEHQSNRRFCKDNGDWKLYSAKSNDIEYNCTECIRFTGFS